MKDFLSEVLLRKRFCVEKCSTTKDVVEVFDGLLSLLCKVKKQSKVSLLASVIGDAIMKEANNVFAVESLTKADIGKVQTTTGKSGILEKLNDNCLGHCIGFLSIKDRLKNAELACRRLFHVSRSVTYGTHEFGGDAAQNLPQTMWGGIARRMHCTKLLVHGSADVMPTLTQCASVLRRRLNYLHFGEGFPFDALLQMSFPQLEVIQLDEFLENDELPSFLAFIRRHVATIEALVVRQPLSAEVLKLVSDCPKIYELSVGCVLEDISELWSQFDLQRIVTLWFDQCRNFALMRPLLQNIKCLTIEEFRDSSVQRQSLQLCALTTLRIDIPPNFPGVSLRNLKLQTPKLKSLKCTASLLDLDECLRLCPRGTVEFTAVLLTFEPSEVSQLCTQLTDIFSDGAFNCDSLDLSFEESLPRNDNKLDTVCEFVQFLVATEQMRPSLTLRITRRMDAHLSRSLGSDVFAKVRDRFTYEIAS